MTEIFARLVLAKKEAHNYSIVIVLKTTARVKVPVKQPNEQLACPRSKVDGIDEHLKFIYLIVLQFGSFFE